MDKIIMHVDANSAYLSWEAAHQLQHGATVDLRDIPSVVGGDEESRHGIVLAKSIPAKKYDIQTGETLFSARHPLILMRAPLSRELKIAAQSLSMSMIRMRPVRYCSPFAK